MFWNWKKYRNKTILFQANFEKASVWISRNRWNVLENFIRNLKKKTFNWLREKCFFLVENILQLVFHCFHTIFSWFETEKFFNFIWKKKLFLRRKKFFLFSFFFHSFLNNIYHHSFEEKNFFNRISEILLASHL